MKKTAAVLVCIIILLALCFSAFAEDFSVNITASEKTLAPGGTLTLKISLSGAPQGNAASLAVNVPDGITVKSGKMVREDAMLSAYDLSKNKGVLSLGKTGDLNGNFAEVTLAADKNASGEKKITVQAAVSPGSSAAVGEITFNIEADGTSSVDTAGNSSGNTSSDTDTGTDTSSGGVTVSVASELVSRYAQENDGEKTSSLNTVLIIVSSVIVAALIAVLLTVIIKGKKKK